MSVLMAASNEYIDGRYILENTHIACEINQDKPSLAVWATARASESASRLQQNSSAVVPGT